MKSKKQYVKPVLKSEKVEIGVFGCYGGGGGSKSPIQYVNPFFGWCCS